ncbi:tetraspanin-16 isoform X2 [Pelodiscus sinensis]|uniref:tetraspanin-16 isoform X2 n=1 Tax=Pelodiscus sinensis TaxID=13735 RepID=UPI003F6B3331
MAPLACGYAFLKTVMICFNIVIFFVGCTMVGLGLWIKLGSTSFVRVLGASSVYFVHVGFFCIVVGSLAVVLGFIACWGAAKESQGLLLTAHSIVLDKSLTALKNKYTGYKDDDIVSFGWNAFMLQLNCCGLHNYTDFSGSVFQLRTNLTYPKTCCKDPRSWACNGLDVGHEVIHQEGCFRKLVSLIKEKSILLGAAATGAAVLQLAAMIVSLMLYIKLG